MKSLHFATLFLIVTILFVSFHSTTWYHFTSNIFGREDKFYVGDLGRMRYEIDSLHPRTIQHTLHKKHFNKQTWQGEKIDILTIGDSFSNADASGINPYYQDYIASTYNLNVLNLKQQKDPISLLISLHKSGWFAQHKPKYVLLERVERFALDLIKPTKNWRPEEHTISELPLAELRAEDPYIQKLSFINTANYKFYFAYLSNIQKKHKFNDIYIFNLREELFTPKKFSNKLLVLGTDIINSVDHDNQKIQELNHTLNELHSLLLKDGVKLIFMPAVDKYDLYYDFIQNNSFPKNYFFNLLRNEKKLYTFIDTKAILLSALNAGEKDIYYADDTHWSNKASELIIKSKAMKQTFSQVEQKHANN